MLSRARVASVFTVLAVAAITAVAALAGGAGSAATIAGTPGRAAPSQTLPIANLAALTLAPAQTNTIYVSVAPCRIVDTRVAGGKLATNTTRNFAVSGTTGFPAQGGTSGGCGIPASATAISASIIAVNPAGNGHLDAWAVGTAQPTASILNFQKGQNNNTGAIIPIKPNANPALSIHAGSGPLDVVIDITGYYAPQIHARVTNAGALDWATSRIVSSSKLQDGVFQVNVDRDLTGCSATASAHGGSPLLTSTAITGSVVIVYVWTTSGTATNAYFYLDVSC